MQKFSKLKKKIIIKNYLLFCTFYLKFLVVNNFKPERSKSLKL